METTGNEARLRKRDLFKAIGYEPHPGQVLVHRSAAPRRVLACGVRWGKSTCGAMEAVASLLEPRERSLGWLVAPSYDNANRIFERVVAVMQGHFAHRLLEASPRDNRVVARNLGGGRSELRVKSADNPVSLLGEGLDWLVVDEASRLKKEIWDEHLSQRLIDRQGTALLLSTPRGCDWFHAMYRRGQKRAKFPDHASWRSPSASNPHLSAAVIEAQRKTLPKDVFDQEYGAVFLGEEMEPCDTCAGPTRTQPASPILYPGEELARCLECRRPVDRDGKSVVYLWPNGTLHMKTIRLAPGPMRDGPYLTQKARDYFGVIPAGAPLVTPSPAPVVRRARLDGSAA